MGALGELYELWTPDLDRDRLFSLIPVHLHSAANELAHVVKRDEEFPSQQRDKVALYTIGLWLLLLAEDGAAPLRPQEVRLINRIMERQKELWSCFKLNEFAQTYAIPRARPHMRDPNSSERIKAYEAEKLAKSLASQAEEEEWLAEMQEKE